MNSKRYAYSYEDWEDNGKSDKTLVSDILEDKEFYSLDELIIGSWGEAWDVSCQQVLDDIVLNADKFSHIKYLFIGDMDSEESEVSWIAQGNYNALLKALPNLKGLTIKGSTDLEFGEINHENLESIEIISGGLPLSVIHSIANAKLPKLNKLLLYLGVENYGFDASIEDIEDFLTNSDFPSLSYLGLTNCEIQDEVTKVVLDSKYINQIEVLDLSNGCLKDTGGELLLNNIPNYPNIKKLNLEYHYLSNEMMKKLANLSVEVNLNSQNEPYSYDDTLYYDPLITE